MAAVQPEKNQSTVSYGDIALKVGVSAAVGVLIAASGGSLSVPVLVGAGIAGGVSAIGEETIVQGVKSAGRFVQRRLSFSGPTEEEQATVLVAEPTKMVDAPKRPQEPSVVPSLTPTLVSSEKNFVAAYKAEKSGPSVLSH